jgi:hypothetical protein
MPYSCNVAMKLKLKPSYMLRDVSMGDLESHQNSSCSKLKYLKPQLIHYSIIYRAVVIGKFEHSREI